MGRGYCVDGGGGAKLTSFPRVYTSFPRHLRHSRVSIRHSRGRGNPEKDKARRFPPLRVLCTTSQTTDSRSDHMRLSVARPLWIPAFAGMTVVMHSSPSRSEGDACEARRGCPKITTILTSFTRLTVIPATPPSFPRVYTSFPRLLRHSRVYTSSRDSSVIPADAGIQRKTKHAA